METSMPIHSSSREMEKWKLTGSVERVYDDCRRSWTCRENNKQTLCVATLTCSSSVFLS